MQPVDSLIDLMRATPLVALRGRSVSRPRAGLLGKLELCLPGAVKDRVALFILREAERTGELEPGGVVVESSSGTMAEALARVGALAGYRVVIVTDPRIDAMTHAKLSALGAEVDVVKGYHPEGGWQRSRLERLFEILRDEPKAFWVRQYDNPMNAQAYEGLAGELLDALGARVGAIVGAVGSGGSLCGTARALRRTVGDLQVVAVDAVGSVLFHQPDRKRLQSGHGNSLIPGNIDYRTIDEVHWLSDGEAFAACRELAQREGIFAGGSSGAVYVVASWLAERLPEDRTVVALLMDRGDRYFETIYSDRFLDGHRLRGAEAAREPERVRYGVDVVERWSRAPLPHDGSVPYHAPEAPRSRDIARELAAR